MERIPLVDLSAHHKEVSDEIFAELKQLVAASDFIGGKRLEKFEKSFGEFTQAPEAIGVANGTDAIIVALRALGVGPGDEVITVANSFIATAEAALLVGAKPVFVDVTDDTSLMDLAQVEAAINPRTKAVLPVHLYGNPVDLVRLAKICERHKLALIQDAAQAHGALWAGRPLAAFGDAQTYSFYPGKNLGGWGDAGAITTSRKELATVMRALRNHGRNPQEKYLHHVAGGGNHRMDPVQAVVLSAKLKHLAAKNERRRKLATDYMEQLAGVGDLKFFRPHAEATSVYHLFVVRTSKREALREHLEKAGVSTGIHYPVPLHLQPALKSVGASKGKFPVAEAHSEQILSLPMFPELTDAQVERISAEVRRFF